MLLCAAFRALAVRDLRLIITAPCLCSSRAAVQPTACLEPFFCQITTHGDKAGSERAGCHYLPQCVVPAGGARTAEPGPASPARPRRSGAPQHHLVPPALPRGGPGDVTGSARAAEDVFVHMFGAEAAEQVCGVRALDGGECRHVSYRQVWSFRFFI